MKFRLPDDCLAVTLGGSGVTIDGDRTFEAADAHAAALAAHGIAQADEPEPAPATIGRGRARHGRGA